MEVLIWGTGNMARLHSARLARRTDVTITAVISRRGGGEPLPGASDARILAGPEELETLPHRPDLAVICLPSDLHRSAAEALMGRVPHILCEKPAALSLEDAIAMADRAEQTGTTLSVAQVLRSWDAYEALSHRLTAGRERLHTLTLWRRQPRPDWSDGGWLADPKRSGGVLFDLAIHDVDYVVSLFGPPERVEASEGPGGESVTLFLRYPTFCAVLYASWCLPSGFASGLEAGVEATFTDELIRFDSRLVSDRWRRYTPQGMEEECFPTWDPYGRQIDTLLEELRGGRSPGRLDIRTVLPALAVCQQAEQLISG